MLQLYQAEWCPFSHLVRQRLTELGIDYVARQVAPWPEERDEMEEAVGSRIIPVAVLDDGTVLDGDAVEIVAELSARFPETPHSTEHHERRTEDRSFRT